MQQSRPFGDDDDHGDDRDGGNRHRDDLADRQAIFVVLVRFRLAIGEENSRDDAAEWPQHAMRHEARREMHHPPAGIDYIVRDQDFPGGPNLPAVGREDRDGLAAVLVVVVVGHALRSKPHAAEQGDQGETEERQALASQHRPDCRMDRIEVVFGEIDDRSECRERCSQRDIDSQASDMERRSRGDHGFARPESRYDRQHGDGGSDVPVERLQYPGERENARHAQRDQHQLGRNGLHIAAVALPGIADAGQSYPGERQILDAQQERPARDHIEQGFGAEIMVAQRPKARLGQDGQNPDAMP